MRTNIYAQTEAGGSLPAYVSLNTEPEGINSLTVRSKGSNDCSTIHMTDSDMRAMAVKIINHLAAKL